ncbi:autotransporter outer membrane beta-barrel domain-containing protein, partial [Pseudomonas sp. MAFF212427]
ARLKGDIKGFALGFADNPVGDVSLHGESVGAYWTLIGPQQWYLDTVMQYTGLDGRARSDRGVKLDLDGHALTASVETGYPLALGSRWAVEPQVQLIVQNVDLDTRNDGISNVSQNSQTNWTGRLGARVTGKHMVGSVPLQPYLRSNLWRSFGGHDSLRFDGGEPIKTDQASTWMDVGVGLSAQLSVDVAVYGGISYSANLDSRQQQTVGGNLGLRISW